MLRRSLLVTAVALLLATQVGCRSQCGERHGWFSSHSRSAAPCQTVGRNTGCFDAATGQPVPCPTGAPTMVVPGGAYPLVVPGGPVVPVGPRPTELPMPGPGDMIRPPAIPYPAPGDAILPFPSSAGTPVKNGLNK